MLNKPFVYFFDNKIHIEYQIKELISYITLECFYIIYILN